MSLPTNPDSLRRFVGYNLPRLHIGFPMEQTRFIRATLGHITTLDSLERMPHLRTLNLSRNHILTLQGLEKAETLRTLVLDHNRFSYILKEQFVPLTRLTRLSLCGLPLRSLETTVAALRHLTALKELRFQISTALSEQQFLVRASPSSRKAYLQYMKHPHALALALGSAAATISGQEEGAGDDSTNLRSGELDETLDWCLLILHGNAGGRKASHGSRPGLGSTMTSTDALMTWCPSADLDEAGEPDRPGRHASPIVIDVEASFHLDRDAASGPSGSVGGVQAGAQGADGLNASASHGHVDEDDDWEGDRDPWNVEGFHDRTADLEPSLLCYERHYRAFMIHHFPNVVVLDDVSVTALQRHLGQCIYADHFEREAMPHGISLPANTYVLTRAREIGAARHFGKPDGPECALHLPCVERPPSPAAAETLTTPSLANDERPPCRSSDQGRGHVGEGTASGPAASCWYCHVDLRDHLTTPFGGLHDQQERQWQWHPPSRPHLRHTWPIRTPQAFRRMVEGTRQTTLAGGVGAWPQMTRILPDDPWADAPRQFEYHPTIPCRIVLGTMRNQVVVVDFGPGEDQGDAVAGVGVSRQRIYGHMDLGSPLLHRRSHQCPPVPPNVVDGPFSLSGLAEAMTGPALGLGSGLAAEVALAGDAGHDDELSPSAAAGSSSPSANPSSSNQVPMRTHDVQMSDSDSDSEQPWGDMHHDDETSHDSDYSSDSDAERGSPRHTFSSNDAREWARMTHALRQRIVHVTQQGASTHSGASTSSGSSADERDMDQPMGTGHVLGLCWLRHSPEKFVAGSDVGALCMCDADRMHDGRKAMVYRYPDFPHLTSVHVSCNDELLLASGYVNDVHIFDVRTGKLVRAMSKLHEMHINVVKFANCTPHYFATSSFDETVKLFDVRVPGTAPCFTCRSNTGHVMVTWSPDDAYLLGSAVDNEIRQWHASDGSLHTRFDIKQAHSPHNYTRAYYLAGGDYVISGSCEEQCLRICSARTGRILRSIDIARHRRLHAPYVQSLRGDPLRPFNCAALIASSIPYRSTELTSISLDEPQRTPEYDVFS